MTLPAPSSHPVPFYIAGGGEVGDLIRRHDWASTPLGTPEQWPAGLKMLVQIMLASNQPMFLVWGPGRTYLYNDVYTSILGLKHPDALGRDFLEVWREIEADIAPLVARAYAGEAVQMNDIALRVERHGYPEDAHFSFFYSPVHSDADTVSGFFCAVTERTAEIAAQRELRESEARYRDVMSRMDEGFILLDRRFHIADVNEHALRLNGLRREQMVGQSHWDLFPGSDTLPVGRMYIAAMADGRPCTLEHQFTWPDGHVSCIDVRAYPTSGGLAVFFRDVTARRAVERQAAESAERVQLALDAGAIVGTWVWDVRDDRVVTDARFARAFGMDAADCATGVPVSRMVACIHAADRERVRHAIAAATRSGGSYRCEYRVLRHDGEYHWVEASGRCEVDERGRATRFPGVLVDVQDRRRAEDERDRAHAMLRTFIEAVPGVVYAKDLQGRMVLANKGTAHLIGQDPERFIGKTDAEFLPDPIAAERVMANDRRILQSGQAEQIEELVPLPDGTPTYWLSSKAPLRDAEGRVTGLIGASVDITLRKREQERAQNEAETLDLLNQTAAVLAAELDLGVLLQTVTDAATQLTGAGFGAFFYNAKDAGGESYTLFTLSGAPREAFEGFGHPRPTPVFETTFRGGPPIRLHDVMADPRYGQWSPHHGMPAGHLPVRSYLAVSVTSRRGEVIGGLFFGHPEPGKFSERSERLAVGIAAQASVAIDNARLYSQAQRDSQDREALLQSERAARAEAERASALKDQFLATLSHELRTPLSAMLGWAQILRRKAGTEPTLARGIDVIERSARVQAQLIEDLLDMSRITSGKLRVERRLTDPAAFVQSAMDSVRPAAEKAGVALTFTASDSVPAVMADPSRMQQVVWNLLSNAIKFSPNGGRVAVSISGDASSAHIRIVDSGIGIAPEFLPHVFDRFRQADGSTTRRFGGLGLGLSIVRQLMDLHGGTVTASSEGPGHGATFVLTLPAADAPDATPPPDAAFSWDHADLRGARVLVVDDEPDARELVSRLLAENGADVFAVATAAEALDVMPVQPPDLLISDVGMAGMDGYELVRQLRRMPEPARSVPAIALTAFAQPEDRARALHAGFDGYVSKPAEPHGLLREVQRLLRAGAIPRDPRSG